MFARAQAGWGAVAHGYVMILSTSSARSHARGDPRADHASMLACGPLLRHFELTAVYKVRGSAGGAGRGDRSGYSEDIRDIRDGRGLDGARALRHRN